MNLAKDSKTKEGRKKIVKSLTSQGVNSFLRNRDTICWQMFNNTSDTKEFEFLTKVGEFDLPSKIRRIPIQRSKANILLSQQALRTVKFSLKIVDGSGINKKLTMMYRSLLMMFYQFADQKYRTLEFQMQQIDSQVQQMQQALQKDPESSEEAQQQAQIRVALPQIIYQTNLVKDNLAQAMTMSKEERDSFINKFKDEYKDLYEVYAHKLLNKMYELHEVKTVSVKNFRNKIVVGREYNYVNFNWKTKELEYKSINPYRLRYPNIEDIEWTQDLPWVSVETFMSKEQIKANFTLTAEQLKILDGLDDSVKSTENGAFVTGPGQAVIYDENASDNNKSKFTITSSGISVKTVWWRADEKVKAIQSPNKYKQGSFFTQFVNGSKDVIDTKMHRYDREEDVYEDSRTGVKKKREDVATYNSGKGEMYVERYFDKRYVGVNINNGTIVFGDEDPVQPHPRDGYGYTPLPIIGRTFNGIGESPYSLIWVTTELQKQYWIVSYHRELTFALAGASGVVFDLSQKPDSMNKEEWFYHMKLGRYLIQTLTKTGARKNTGYNQFSRVDQTLTNSIQYFELILQGIEQQIGTLMGVPRQREGEVRDTDQVGTFAQSNKQAMLVTEIMFKEHDEVERKSAEALLNLATQYRYKPNEVVDVSDEETEIIELPYDMNDRKFRLKLVNSAKQDMDLDEMKRMSGQMAARGVLPYDFLFKIFSIDSMKELEQAVVKQTKIQQELRMQEIQANSDAEAKAEQAKIELENNFKMQMQAMELKLKDAQLRVEQMLGMRGLDIEQAKVAAEAQNKEMDVNIKVQEKMIDTKLDFSKHQEEVRRNKVDEQLKLIELRLESMLKSASINHKLGISGSNPV